MEHKVKILMTGFVTHDVKRFIVEKPTGFKFVPGQATKITINKEDFIEKKNPFTFTSLNDAKVLEFTIKGYPKHDGVTNELHKLAPGDELLLRDPFGTINYKGKGVFIAGGAGITPFIAILRDLEKKGEIEGNKLIFSNKTSKDIILEKEFKEMLGSDAVFTLTREGKVGYESGRINEQLLKKYVEDFNQNFYLCGPKQFVKEIKTILEKLGASVEGIVVEE